jgi:hypothetical protein
MTARFLLLFTLMLAAGGPAVLRADLKQVKAEPNLEKRSKLALDLAESTLKEARTVYGNGDTAKVTPLIAQVREAVELAEQSLKETGKNPRKSPKYFKRAEIETRALLKRIEAFQDEMNVNDRPSLDVLRSKVQQVHDDLLMGIMEGKKK